MDYAVMTRAFLADPEWAKKAREGRSEEIKPCIGCLYCLERTGLYRRGICAVNPRLIRMEEFPDRGRDLEGKKVIVVGAGPAGLEAAVGCVRRGAVVTVYEKREFIGGAAALGSRTPHKAPLMWLVNYYETMAKRLGIVIKLGTEITEEQIMEEKPWAVFVACGAAPVTLPFARPDGKRIFTVDQVLEQDLQFKGEKIVVVGGGMTGCEVAEYYAMMGNNITLIEMRDVLAPEVDPDNLVTVLENLKKAGGIVLLSHKFVALENTDVVAERTDSGERVNLPADRIILSLGGVPNNGLYQELTGCLDNVIAVGDTARVGRVANAVRTGFEKSYILD
jgi:pyruvate/2-oxoglutarate dehydrogenase complex dihydrolipoamide dehydrogenase (E3) component